MRLYVGNLSYSTTEEELKELFSQAGAVTSVALIKDRDTGRSKGFAFIEMGSQVEAEKAITMFNGVQFNTRTLTVSIARPREERGPGGGGRGGSGGGYGDRDRRPGGGQRDRRSTGGTRRY
ncbi:MAG: RNA-binding protein [Chloroflexota bacterium]|nr:MAG: RNA-binding protein [Chloroflexota bacterium]